LSQILSLKSNKRKDEWKGLEREIRENKGEVLVKEEGTKLEPHFPTTKGAIFDAISCAMKCACRITKHHGVRANEGGWIRRTGKSLQFFQPFIFLNVTHDMVKYSKESSWP